MVGIIIGYSVVFMLLYILIYATPKLELPDISGQITNLAKINLTNITGLQPVKAFFHQVIMSPNKYEYIQLQVSQNHLCGKQCFVFFSFFLLLQYRPWPSCLLMLRLCNRTHCNVCIYLYPYPICVHYILGLVYLFLLHDSIMQYVLDYF